MLKHIYRIIILIFIFSGALYYFSKDIEEEVNQTQGTVSMGKASFPVVMIRQGGKEYNLLHGYSNNLDASLVREAVTPLGSDQSFDVVIDGKENDVKRVIYELRDTKNNSLLDTDTINALEKEEDYKTAHIKLKTDLTGGKEYSVKLTLVTSKSRKINFYTLVKKVENSYLAEKLDFITDFHDSIMDKKKATGIIAYLEPESSADSTSLAHVDIHSSFELISWGNLNPKVVGPVIPTIDEIDSDTASVTLGYTVKAKTESGEELYRVKEFYRVRYTSTRMYLLNYNRTMESYFDVELTSLAKSEFKLGITSDQDIDYVTDSKKVKIAFARMGELWYYNLTENKMTRVFSFRESDTDYIRDIYGEHDIQILKMDDDGNVDFMVYGYMNRGAYEGCVGMIFYRFYSNENRIEELLYIPMNITYQLLKEELDGFSYVNNKQVFYFILNNKIYSYNLITDNLSAIAEDVKKDNYIVDVNKHYIAWENARDKKDVTEIEVLDLESGMKDSLKAPEGEIINLLGKIDDNLIYGYGKKDNYTTATDGTLLTLLYKVEIADKDKNILKEYKKSGYYITGASAQGNIITLNRQKKDGGGDYEEADDDYILNRVTGSYKAFGITQRVTEKTLTESYIALPGGYTMTELPALSKTKNTIITKDTTLRLKDSVLTLPPFIVYAGGESAGAYDRAGEAINEAYNLAGIVVGDKQQIVWERVVRSSQISLSGIKPIYEYGDSLRACVAMLSSYKKGYEDTNPKGDSLTAMLKEKFGESYLNISDAALDQVLYYLNKNQPVIGMKSKNQAVLIVGCDMYNITVIDPDLGKTMKIGLKDAGEMFEKAENRFFTYLQD
ncbi:hypothetical protein [Anaerocolumna xylanovorans]|uniref:Peptidase_C39 like family protein n=1 Tax=Anaerocolumna xylanovorans DSM 12503 TaxID=1121345 RepID=A0A1M7Y9W6_9FIRM|nr:hypothetical protein [Anaerocolumna xylanovorans]SHO49410.1 hypothetical protein SAMN02745217_02294 [Anaerocolumna xylanovorans DSM 12503]